MPASPDVYRRINRPYAPTSYRIGRGLHDGSDPKLPLACTNTGPYFNPDCLEVSAIGRGDGPGDFEVSVRRPFPNGTAMIAPVSPLCKRAIELTGNGEKDPDERLATCADTIGDKNPDLPYFPKSGNEDAVLIVQPETPGKDPYEMITVSLQTAEEIDQQDAQEARLDIPALPVCGGTLVLLSGVVLWKKSLGPWLEEKKIIAKANRRKPANTAHQIYDEAMKPAPPIAPPEPTKELTAEEMLEEYRQEVADILEGNAERKRKSHHPQRSTPIPVMNGVPEMEGLNVTDEGIRKVEALIEDDLLQQRIAEMERKANLAVDNTFNALAKRFGLLGNRKTRARQIMDAIEAERAARAKNITPSHRS